MSCQLCHSEKRTLRFQTKRLRICQWCITLLCQRKESPSQILKTQRILLESHLREKLLKLSNELSEKKPLHPILNIAELQKADTKAVSVVRQKYGKVASIFRRLFCFKVWQSEIEGMQKFYRSELFSKFSEEMDLYNQKIEIHSAQLEECNQQLVNVSELAEIELRVFLSNIESCTTLKARQLILLRAFKIGLINYENMVIGRPDKDEFKHTRSFVRKQDAFSCVCCGKKSKDAEQHVHHIIPLYQYGTNDKKNLVTLCYSCHDKQHKEFKINHVDLMSLVV